MGGSITLIGRSVVYIIHIVSCLSCGKFDILSDVQELSCHNLSLSDMYTSEVEFSTVVQVLMGQRGMGQWSGWLSVMGDQRNTYHSYLHRVALERFQWAVHGLPTPTMDLDYPEGFPVFVKRSSIVQLQLRLCCDGIGTLLARLLVCTCSTQHMKLFYVLVTRQNNVLMQVCAVVSVVHGLPSATY